jgi:hypothetical protein
MEYELGGRTVDRSSREFGESLEVAGCREMFKFVHP